MTFKKPFDYSSTKRDKNSKCAWIKIFHQNLSKTFYNLGFLVGSSPSYFIIVPIFLSLIFVTGFQTMTYEKDPEYLFSPVNAIGREERQIVEDLFPMNYSFSFDPSRITKISAFVRLIITAKDKETVLRTHLWDEIMQLDSLVQNVTINWRETEYAYEDVCAIWRSKCLENQILDLYQIMPEVENGSRVVDYPIMMFPMVFPFFYGGVKVNETESYMESASGIVLHYWLKEDDSGQKERSLLWENGILKMLEEQDFESIEIAPFVSMSLEDELESNTSSIIGYLPPTVLIMVIFSIVSTISCDWVRSKIQISVMGIMTAGLGTICSFGLLMYCGIPFIGINLAAPFLLLGIGIDDMFVVLSAWRRTRIQDDVPLRLAETYKEAAVSITITSLTNMLSFFIGAITPFPSVYIFCIYTGVSILLTYIFFITFFGGCLALAGHQEMKQAHAISCRAVKAKSESEAESACYNIWCSGGINSLDPWNRKDNQPDGPMVFFRDYVSWGLNNPFIKALIILAFLGYLAGAVYGCLHIKEGLEKKNLALDDSYLTSYYEKEDTLFRKFPYRIQVIIKENISYSDPETKRSLLRLHRSFENLTCIGPSFFTQSWVRGFRRFLRMNPKIRKNVTDEASFIKVLREEYLTPEMPEHLDVVFNEDFSRIVASRFVIQAFEIKDTNEDKDMMLEVRRVAREAPFEVHTYYPLFVFFDQFVLVAPLTLQTIMAVALLMMLVSLIFIPHPLCCLWVIFSIISIELGVMGYMSLWGVSLDCISMINLIMCIGFSVDFSAHISYAYLTAKADTPSERVRECMFNLGFPVVQSGLSTIAGVFMFVVAPSNIFRTFFKIICLVITFGTMHALLLLPVMLSIFGPGSCRSKKTESSLTATIATIAHVEANDKSCNTVCVVTPPLAPPEKGLSSESSGSVYSESILEAHDDSDSESTRASSRSQVSEEISETCFPVDDEDQGNTYL